MLGAVADSLASLLQAEPDPRCLSYTHDRDFGAFLDYPPGAPRPLTSAAHCSGGGRTGRSAEAVAMAAKRLDRAAGKENYRGGGWCPPAFACYDAMAPVFKGARKDEL